MSNSTEQCLFCNKAKQKIIYSSKLVFVVRDSYPVTKLHTLIIPHRHVSNFFDLNEDELIDLNPIIILNKRPKGYKIYRPNQQSRRFIK